MELINSKKLEDNILESEIFKIIDKEYNKISVEDNIMKLKLQYNKKSFDLLFSDSMKFCFLKSNYYDVDDINVKISKNINLLSYEMLLDIILSNIMVKINKTDKNKIFQDQLSLFHKNKIKSKFDIDINKIKDFYSNFDNNKVETYDIPKDLLFTSDQILKLIIKEVVKVNNNFDNLFYIFPLNNNPYELIVRFKYENCKLADLLNEINSKYNFDYIEIILVLNPQLYPYFPPKIKYNKPLINHSLLFGILDMDILKLRNWNPIFSLDLFINELGKQFEKCFIENINFDPNKKLNNFEASEFENNLIDISILTKNVPDNKVNFDFNISKVNFKESGLSDENKYWKSGVGYGYSGKRKWNIEEFIKNEKKNAEEICLKLDYLNLKLDNSNIDLFFSSGVPNYLISQIHGSNLLLFDENITTYNSIFSILLKICDFDVNIDFSNKIYSHIKSVEDEISDLIIQMEKMKNIDDIKLNFYKLISKTCLIYSKKSTINDIFIKEVESKIDSYKNMIKKYQDEYFKSNYEIKQSHKFYKMKENNIPQKTLLRIMSEISILKSLPQEWDASILINYSKDNINLMTSIVTGPKDTPYHNGLFEFHMYFPDTYPKNPPKVLIETNGNGKVRFNPNLYAGEGKVCLSLLGTWSGEGAEVWNNKSTSLQVLNSIQSLILVDEPYFNEPGWERQMHTDSGKRKCFDYKDNIRLQTIIWAINNQIKNPPHGFEGFVKEHFFAKKDELIEVTKLWVKESKKHKTDMDRERNKMIKLLSDLNSDSEIEIDLSLSDKKKSADSKESTEESTEEQPPPYSKFVIGDEVQCKDIWYVKDKKVEKWRKGKVIEYDNEKGWKIHFIGWKDKWDTYIKNEDCKDRIKDLDIPYIKSSSLEIDDFKNEKENKIIIKKVNNINNLKIKINSPMKKYSIVELKLKEGNEYFVKAKMNLFPEYKDYEFKNGFKGIGYYKK